MGVFDGFAGAIVGPLIGGYQQRRQDAKQRNLNQEQNQWEADMANSSHQREVQDLKLAGLNPILSAGGGGAATPNGDPAQTGQMPAINLPDMLTYGVSMKQLEQASQKLDIDRANSAAAIAKNLTDQELTRAQTILAQKGMFKADMEGELFKQFGPMLKAIMKQTRQQVQPGNLEFSNPNLPGKP